MGCVQSHSHPARRHLQCFFPRQFSSVSTHVFPQQSSIHARVMKKHMIAALALSKLSSSPKGREQRAPTSKPGRSSMFAGKEDFQDATEEALVERRLEAVYVSYSLFGCWRPDQLVYPQTSGAMSWPRFLALCKAAGLIDGQRVTLDALRNIFQSLVDKKTMKLEFPRFFMALDKISAQANKNPDEIMQHVLEINSEGLLRIRLTAET